MRESVIIAPLAVLKMRHIFLISCDKYKIDRKILFDFVNRTVQNFSLLNSEQKLVFLLSNEDCQVLNAYGKFVKDNLR